jgi:hypothetical protein
MFSRTIAALAVTTLAFIAGAPAEGGIVPKGQRDEGAREVEAPDASLAAVALLPPDVRTLVLEAALHPDLLEALALLNASTSRQMSELTADLPDAQQGMAWLLLAHPELVDALVSVATRPGALRVLLAAHPEPVSEAARSLLRDDPKLVREIFALESRAADHFDALLGHRSLETQHTFRQLLDEPRALSLVMTEQALLRSLGVLYRHDAVATHRALDQISQASLAEHASALPGWESTRAVETHTTLVGEGDRIAVVESVRMVDDAPLRDSEAVGTSSAPADAAEISSIGTPRRAPSVSVWLGGCASRGAGFATSGLGGTVAVRGPRTAPASTGAASSRVWSTARQARGQSVVVWPRGGPGEARTETRRSHSRGSISYSRDSRRYESGRRVTRMPARGVMRSEVVARSPRTPSRFGSVPSRQSMKVSRSKPGRGSGALRGRRGRR